MIKKAKYTLIELLVSMTIFVIMMGILMSTFSTAADIAASETTKVNILTDASVFFGYITKDLKTLQIQNFPQYKDYQGNPQDPEQSNNATNAYVGTELDFTTSTLSFFSDTTGYDINQDGNDDFAAFSPYVHYELIGTNIVRELYDDENMTTAGSAPVDYSGDKNNPNTDYRPIIVEGVESLTFKVWDDYPGGTELTTSPIETAPACITISVTLTNPSPYAADEIKARNKRTITKTVYINR